MKTLCILILVVIFSVVCSTLRTLYAVDIDTVDYPRLSLSQTTVVNQAFNIPISSDRVLIFTSRPGKQFAFVLVPKTSLWQNSTGVLRAHAPRMHESAQVTTIRLLKNSNGDYVQVGALAGQRKLVSNQSNTWAVIDGRMYCDVDRTDAVLFVFEVDQDANRVLDDVYIGFYPDANGQTVSGDPIGVINAEPGTGTQTMGYSKLHPYYFAMVVDPSLILLSKNYENEEGLITSFLEDYDFAKSTISLFSDPSVSSLSRAAAEKVFSDAGANAALLHVTLSTWELVFNVKTANISGMVDQLESEIDEIITKTRDIFASYTFIRLKNSIRIARHALNTYHVEKLGNELETYIAYTLHRAVHQDRDLMDKVAADLGIGYFSYDKDLAVKLWQSGKDLTRAHSWMDQLMLTAPHFDTDVDGDGISNLDERDQNTDPNHAFVKNPPELSLIPIPAGTFQMGDSVGEGNANELPVHSVTLSSFRISKHEITNKQYSDLMNWAIGQGKATATSNSVMTMINGSNRELLDLDSVYSELSWDGAKLKILPGREYHPLVEVSWYGAMAYCAFLNDQQGLPQSVDLNTATIDTQSSGYRLPTEAEWEYAARGGLSGQSYPWGNDVIDESRSRYSQSNAIPSATLPVGSLPANAYGLHDMAGNVWEWVADTYVSSYPNESRNNPLVLSGINRVYRGGGWHSAPASSRCAKRGGANNPEVGINSLGFRPVRSYPVNRVAYLVNDSKSIAKNDTDIISFMEAGGGEVDIIDAIKIGNDPTALNEYTVIVSFSHGSQQVVTNFSEQVLTRIEQAISAGAHFYTNREVISSKVGSHLGLIEAKSNGAWYPAKPDSYYMTSFYPVMGELSDGVSLAPNNSNSVSYWTSGDKPGLIWRVNNNSSYAGRIVSGQKLDSPPAGHLSRGFGTGFSVGPIADRSPYWHYGQGHFLMLDFMLWTNGGSTFGNAGKKILSNLGLGKTANFENQSPIITSTAPSNATEDITFSYAVQVNDPDDQNDGNSLLWSLINAPSGMSISNKGVVTWTPREGVTTSGTVIIQVEDGGEDSAIPATQQMIINVTPVNDQPKIVNSAPTAAEEGTLFIHTVEVEDPDDVLNHLNFALSNEPEGMTISDEGRISWIPPRGATSSGQFTVIVSDGGEDGAEAVTQSITLTVNPAPVTRSIWISLSDSEGQGISEKDVHLYVEEELSDSERTDTTGTITEQFMLEVDQNAIIEFSAPVESNG